MRKFKRLSLLFFLGGFTLVACGNSQPKTENTESFETNITVNTDTEISTKGKPIYLTKADFLAKVMDFEKNPEEWKYLGDKPALIDFYADWCGPCKKIAPMLEELAAEYDNDIYIYKIDVDKEKELAGIFGIQSIPSLLFVPMEGAPQMARGALPKAEMSKAITEVLLKK